MTPKGLCPLNFSSKVGTLMYFLRPGEALGPDTGDIEELRLVALGRVKFCWLPFSKCHHMPGARFGSGAGRTLLSLLFSKPRDFPYPLAFSPPAALTFTPSSPDSCLGWVP